LHYSLGLSADFDDRLLFHIQMVIGSKLRRGESFYFSWKNDGKQAEGRTSIWIDSALPLVYKFWSSSPPVLNKDWLDALTRTANSTSGLQVVPEPTLERREP
jgi:hypothetical protein